MSPSAHEMHLLSLLAAAGEDVGRAHLCEQSGLEDEAFQAALGALVARDFVRVATTRCFATRAGLRAYLGASRAIGETEVESAFIITLKEEAQTFFEVVAPQRSLVVDDEGTHYYQFTMGARRCVAVMLGNMGPPEAALFTERLLKRWKPRGVVMLGLAAGIHDDVKLGDVVVAQQVDDYTSCIKAIDAGEDWEFQHRGEVYRADYPTLTAINNLSLARPDLVERWQNAHAADLRASLGGEALVQLGNYLRPRVQYELADVASGPVLASSRAFLAWVKQRNRAFQALEMEAAGFMRAVWSRRSPPPSLVLRAVSDFGDTRKAALDGTGDGAVRGLGVRNAARFVQMLHEAGVLPGT